ncbi:MAG: kynureninase [Acidimicrobiales bacterium]
MAPTTATTVTDPARAAALDDEDPLAGFRDLFVVPDPGLVYLDGNSLGRLPRRTVERLARVVEEEWGGGLIGSWGHWQRLPREVGDLVGEGLLGARPGEVLVSDSTSVNLYKLAMAAVDARPGRSVIVTDNDNFPTDRYILEGIARQRGLELRLVATDIDRGLDLDAVAEAMGPDVALASFSHVAYRSGALSDMAAVTGLAHEAGALVLWDLCHSVGAVPVDLAGAGADLAVGCTYKYLNAGPGAPAFLYVSAALGPELRQPIWGWFGRRDPFAMGQGYEPMEGIGRFLVGSPSVLGLCAVEEGARMVVEAGIERVRAKGVALTRYLVELADAWLAPLGLALASPRDPARRGSHVSLRHPDAEGLVDALAKRCSVVADHRTPERVRLGPSPLSTSFSELREGMERLRGLVEAGHG